jgi:hypothetical protein
LLSKATLS